MCFVGGVIADQRQRSSAKGLFGQQPVGAGSRWQARSDGLAAETGTAAGTAA